MSAPPKNRKLVAALACRTQSTRLYSKPLQNLDVEAGISILDHIIACLSTLDAIDDIILGIAEGSANHIFIDYAKDKNIKYIIGSEADVLSRLILCGQLVGASDIFRITSESPFLCYEFVKPSWQRHVAEGAHATFLDYVIQGCNFEILSLPVLEEAHAKHQSHDQLEHCSLYVRENMSQFKIIRMAVPKELIRRDLRLTVDNPEDLVLCRAAYKALKDFTPQIPVAKIIDFIDENKQLSDLIKPFVEDGYAKMYIGIE